MNIEPTIIRSEWHNLYSDSWQGDMIPDAFSHPAKFSRGLIRQIYAHLLERGYVKPGDIVVDCFGGVAAGALDAMRHGLHWRGVELEEKFCNLARQNIALWNGRYCDWMPQWGTAEIVQGDSRRLCEVLGGARVVVSSPPYIDSVNTKGNGIDETKYKYTRSDKGEHRNVNVDMLYGTAPGQLGSMKEGSPPSAVISSPPYADAVNGQGEGPGARHDHKYHSGDNATKKSSDTAYGETAGQMGGMAVVGSPPFADSIGTKDEKFWAEHNRRQRNWNGATTAIQDYGSTPNNIGNDQGSTFWQAARVIVEQCHQLLPVGGVAVWVCGDFQRKGKRVEFGKQWLALCEAVGFEPLEHIIAWKREPGPVQVGMFEDRDMTIDRVSFFRRLANQNNPEAAILNEDVWIVRKSCAPVIQYHQQ